MAKGTKRFAGGGLNDIGGYKLSPDMSRNFTNSGNGVSQRMSNLGSFGSSSPSSSGLRISPTTISQPRSTFSELTGTSAPKGYGLKIDIGSNTAVKKKAKGGAIKKMAKGGSTASKRADGCATKGKTKGRFV